MNITGKPKTGRPEKASYREGRSKQINIRVSSDDILKLDQLASYYGVTRTDLILMVIDAEYREMRMKLKEIQ